jgi:hypothetical protein
MIPCSGTDGCGIDDRSRAQRRRRLTDAWRKPRGESLEASRRLECLWLTGRQSADIGIEVVDAAYAVCADVLQACAT